MKVLPFHRHNRTRRGAKASELEQKLPLSISRREMLVDGSDQEFRRLIYRMLITAARLADIRNALAARVGVSGTQYTMLMSVLHFQGTDGISIGALAEHLEVTGPHVTSEIRKLAALGLVRKVANPSDRRGVLVRLSADGRKRLLRAFTFIRGVNDRLFAEVTGAEFEALVGFNRKFVRNTEATLAWMTQESVAEAASNL
ncbi:MAG: MarR family winged helix-turn-helix transcriptional regulator [Xanthobacteraceae bacterium]